MTSRQAEVYSKALDSEILLHGGDHPAVARAHTSYGEWLLIEGDVGAARYQLETALRIYSTLANGVLDEDWIDAHYRVGQAIAAESRVTGSNAASRNHFLKTLSMREDFDAARARDRTTAPGDSAPPLPTLSSNMDSTLIYSDLAESDRAAGNYKDAAMLYSKSIKLRRDKFGDASAAVGQVLLKYGETLRLSLKYAEAKTAIDEALAIFMQLYGPKHVAVTEALNAAGQIQRLLGHLQEAEALLLESLQLRREMHGDLHVSTASSLNNLAEVCREKEDFFQAISYHNLAIEAFSKSVGAEHPGTMNARGNLGVTLRRQARQSENLGQELVKQTMDYLRTQQYDADHPWRAKFDTENAMAQAEHLAAQGKIDESLELYEALFNKKHIVAQLNATTAPGTPRKSRLAASTSPLDVASPKKASQDVVLLAEGKVQGLLRRAHALCGRGQFAEAEGVYAATLASSRAILGIDSLHVYRCMVAHAECLTRLGRYPQAQAVLEEALQVPQNIYFFPRYISLAFTNPFFHPSISAPSPGPHRPQGPRRRRGRRGLLRAGPGVPPLRQLRHRPGPVRARPGVCGRDAAQGPVFHGEDLNHGRLGLGAARAHARPQRAARPHSPRPGAAADAEGLVAQVARSADAGEGEYLQDPRREPCALHRHTLSRGCQSRRGGQPARGD